MNNKNYKIYTDQGDFVFRLPGKGLNESVSRASELFNSQVAREIGIDCHTVYFDQRPGLKITEYLVVAMLAGSLFSIGKYFLSAL